MEVVAEEAAVAAGLRRHAAGHNRNSRKTITARVSPITVASRPERKAEGEFKRETVFSQKVKNDPIDQMRERRESLAGRDWLVLEFDSRTTLKPWADIY